MSNRKRRRAKQNLFRQIWQLSINSLTRIFKWFLRCYVLILRGINRRQAHLAKSGFILPTVAMVTLIVVLLTTALVFRSFDRAGKASNIRVNQAVLNAAMPAIDRARAKIDALLNDPNLPRDTPSDLALSTVLQSSTYNFGGETRLKLVSNVNGTSGIQKILDGESYSLENDDTLTTAWKFPIDTDNNGRFDSYTLYGIYFRSPTRDSDGKFDRSRSSLDARTPPMSGGDLGSQCQNALGTSSSLVGDSSWYRSGSKLKKSFFVYTATVPIITPPTGDSNYEAHTGNKAFSALEYQQDRSRSPLNNNAVLFQDDLQITPGPAFKLNGRVFTNANLLIGSDNTLELYQVSSKHSCYYKEENSKITVGGNVAFGNFSSNLDADRPVKVHLYRGFETEPDFTAEINSTNKSTSSTGGAQVGYNDAAYNRRIALMVTTALSYSTTNPPTVTSVNGVTQYPDEIKDNFEKRLEADGGESLNPQDVLTEEIEQYLKDRTRRVPYKEVTAADGTGALTSGGTTYTSANVFSGTVEPPAVWREPTDTNTTLTLSIDTSGTTKKARLPQTQPEKQRKDGTETYVGDRVYVGNNLPAYWKTADGKYVGFSEKQFLGNDVKWDAPTSELRYRTTQVTALPNVGRTDRDGFWEDAAAQAVTNSSPNVGGLRVITGAGIYRNNDSTYDALDGDTTASLTLPPTALDSGATPGNAPRLAGEASATAYKLVWTDMMPMKGGDGNDAPPDLRMRATAVYHYKDNAGIAQTPIACVSSYYDPTDATTAKNGKYDTDNRFPWGPNGTNLPFNNAAGGRSNNGIVYPSPYTTDTARFTAIGTYLAELKAQAKLMFPNGRIVNEPLQNALMKLDSSGALADSDKPLSLSENSAIDTAICGIRILTDNSFDPAATPPIPHGAIKEATILNGREVKSVGANSDYDLALEQRQPLEIRLTDINFSTDNTVGITRQTIGGSTKQEYLLPNSGIIYASRDDGLRDESFTSGTTVDKQLLSPTDFVLDSTRRSNAIRLIKGSNLARVNTYREEEKGLILVTNLPAYVQADADNGNGFNLHQKPGTTTAVEEFTSTLESVDDSTYRDEFYDRDTLDNNFACRSGQAGCATGSNAGDQWRPATIIADTITALSGSYRDGFRNEGDFDLRNNAGSSATSKYKKNGFWDNNYVTSALWWNTGNTDNAYPYEKTTNSYVGSYLINGITPIQRRVDFPEYVMEICRKIPASTCQPGDWFVGYDSDGNGVVTAAERDIKARDLPANADVARLVAGTTARAALVAADQRYARRVAFKRRSNNTLEIVEVSSNPTPIPYGINSSAQVAEFPYSTPTTLPRTADNALWFRTTTNTSGRPNLDPSYASDKPLAYTSDTQLVSPPTPEIPGIPSLNLPDGNPASGLTICTDQNSAGATKNFLIDDASDIDLNKCSGLPGNPMAQVTAARADLVDTTKFGAGINGTVTPTRSGTTGAFPAAAGTETIFTSNPPAPSTSTVNVIEIDGSFSTSTGCTTIKLVGNENSIFVFRKAGNSALDFGADSGNSSHCGVQVRLEGVEPNNVFWAINANVKWNEVSSDPSKRHKMVGTFITDSTGSPKWKTVDFDDGGRLLGPNGVPSSTGKDPNFSNSTIKAISSTEQPLLIPVTQVHTPEGVPGSSLDNSGGQIELEWIQNVTAEKTKINATFVAGNSPSRPEEGADDFENFVRFLERWSAYNNIDTKRELYLQGSFIQLRRSLYATAPKNHVLDASNYASGLSIFGYDRKGYKEKDNNDFGNKTPYFQAPRRKYGFDVALLSQPPDLFTLKFTLPMKGAPEEFFREVGRDDNWVKTLLCAAQGSGSSYTYAVDDASLRGSCLSESNYND